MPATDRFSHPARTRRTTLIVAAVVLAHGLGLWALQSGLARKAVEVIVPAELLSEFLAPPAPTPAPTPAPPPPAPPSPAVAPRPPVARPTATPQPAPLPLAVADAPATPHTPLGTLNAPAPLAAIDAPVAAAPAPAPVAAAAPAAPAAPRIELPSSDAAHLNNPRPPYPAVSKRMGEQGKVLLRVLIGADGVPQKVEIAQSSGFDRLDRQALDTVMRWRFVPGKRNGVPEAMWYQQPVNFVLE